MDKGTVVGVLILIGLLYLIYRVLKGIYNAIQSFRLNRRRMHFAAMGAFVYMNCLRPLGRSVQELVRNGASFKDIDFTELKKKHHLDPASDAAWVLNRIFEKEVDDVVETYRDRADVAITYINGWLGDTHTGVFSATDTVIALWKDGSLQLSFKDVTAIGTTCREYVETTESQQKVDALLRGEFVLEDETDADEGDGDEDYYEAESSNEDYAAPAPARESRQQSFSHNRPQPQRPPTQRQAPQPRQQSEKFIVQRMGAGQSNYQNVTGGDSNMRNAVRRMEQSQKAHAGSDNLKGNSSQARYRIVDKNGKVQ